MFQDIGVSKTLIIEYEKYCENHQIIDNGTNHLPNLLHHPSLFHSSRFLCDGS